MSARLCFFPVGNGDMTLVELASGRKILIDVNIRDAADDPDDDTPDVTSMLRERLVPDNAGRLYVDAFLLSHPDQDHCNGLLEHFHLGPPDDWRKEDGKILIREVWSSPMVFRRANRNLNFCEDAKAFNAEARRRVKAWRDTGGTVDEGNRILILGEDENGKTEGLDDILVRIDESFSKVNGVHDDSFRAVLLAPLPVSDDEEEEDRLSKNKSSTIIQFSLESDGNKDACRFLTGGDAEVAVWERLWDRHSPNLNQDALSYDVSQAPHHCSWRSLSHYSWSKKGEDALVSATARSALSQGRPGALIIASSNAIKDDNNDPPCIRARREYEAIAKEVNGQFKCVGELPSEEAPGLMEIEVTRAGPKLRTALMGGSGIISSGSVGRQPLPHG